MAQTVRICLQMQETWVQSLSQVDPLEKGLATHSSILAWKIPWTEEPWWATVHGVSELDTTEATEHAHIKSQLLGWGVSGVSDYQVGVLTDNAADAQQWSEGRWEMQSSSKIPSRWPLHENTERRSWSQKPSPEMNPVSLQDLPGHGWKSMLIYCQTFPVMPVLLQVQG